MKTAYAVGMVAAVLLAGTWVAMAPGQAAKPAAAPAGATSAPAATPATATSPTTGPATTQASTRQAYNPPPAAVPAKITYTDAATGREAAVSGELLFDSWPVRLDGKPVGIDKWELVHYQAVRGERFHVWMRQVEPGVFVISSLRAVWRVRFDFDSIPVVAAGATRPAGVAVAFRVTTPGAPAAIPVAAIREIDMIQVNWNPFTRPR